MAQGKVSLVVKVAAVAIWSTEVLRCRSVTGTLSNRFVAEGGTLPPQAALTPHKVKVVHSKYHVGLSTECKENIALLRFCCSSMCKQIIISF